MALDRELVRFHQELQSEVLDRAQSGMDGLETAGNAGIFKENVFAKVVLEDLLEEGVLEEGEACHYQGRSGTGAVKVNGYGLSDEETRLDLFVAIYRHEPEPGPVSAKDVRDALDRTVRFYRDMVAGRFEELEEASDAYGMGTRICEAAATIVKVRVFLFTDGLVGLKSIEDKSFGKVKVSHQIWDIERLYRSLAAGRSHAAIEIDIEKLTGRPIPCLQVPSSEAPYKAILCYFPGDLLYDLYEEYGGQLLELNVRSFLMAKGKVNKGIRDTILHEPGYFFAYNNGLSVTAAEVRTVRLADGRPGLKYIRGLQIVNGGQTTASLHRARRTDRADLSRVFVQVKITQVDDDRLDEMVPKISRYSNSQNAVNEADFSANHPAHVELERLSLATWTPGEQSRWFYERARGQYQVAKAREASTAAQKRKFDEKTPPGKKFTKVDLAKYVNSWEQLPHIVGRGGQKNFVAFMDDWVSKAPDWTPDATYYKELIAKAILFRQTQRLVASEEIPAYRANVVAYTIAYLASVADGKFDLQRVWDHQELSDATEEAIRAWCRKIYTSILKSAGARNVGEWCKKEECWDVVRDLDLNIPATLERELAHKRSVRRRPA